ncbi:hypothetical protein [Actinocatenispora comari]|uniref:Nucleotidyltransferase domain-containing protein n=1 Tax=Actinocatenispora comari TaxID=2807577 RepID=A0A8J4A9C2_9ACTN|nr:hypothetical protein [Actinocatenispora comari]GIL27401.1 hypothetical protein NUM_26550 [Actinocatenispora comari]
MTDPAQDRARGVALDAARIWQDAFGERLTAAYLLGSLAHGGYAPAASDIDLGVVLADAREGDRQRADDCATAVRERAGLYGKVSAFWASLPALRAGRDDGRFPALDRLDLADHGQLLLGVDVRATVARPGRTELLVDSGRFALSVLAVPEVVAEFHHPQRLVTDTVLFTKAVLFPVRFLHATAGDGAPAGNDVALDWYFAQPDPVSAPLVRLAASVRAGAPLDPDAALPLLAELRPLYRHYIDDRVERLRLAGAPDDLISGFGAWRDQLRG